MRRPFLLLFPGLAALLFLLIAARPCADASSPVGSITRSDSIDILHTTIALDLRRTGSNLIAARADLTFTPRVPGITALPLDLLALTVDSVLRGSEHLAFTHVGEVLNVLLNGTFGPADTLTVSIHYHGDPVTDPSGFGGFYTLASYQYDLGVAFNAVPHSFGRSWFPCFDNFVERCTFDHIVRTNGGRSVTGNGALVEETDLGNGEKLTHWRISEPIPSYLASVAAANYATVRDTFTSVTGARVPVTLVAHPQDTVRMKRSFVHLRNAFDTYERWFGPYRWERVGYVLTSAGAMEHPTNICYPDFAADGSLDNEQLFAHELAHHWFGDLITCHRPEEMYINEGFADLCSYLFLEDLYGRAAYMAQVRRVHHDMVLKAHLDDDGWYALNNVPPAVTYGDHSYKKGADYIHALRGYLGDSLFRTGFQRVLTNNAFTDMSTAELRDSLSAATGVDLTHYFADWIEQPGWATFEVDSFHTTIAGSTHPTTVFIEQKLRHADHYYHDVPVYLTFRSANGEHWTTPERVMLSGRYSTVTGDPPFVPAHVLIDATRSLSFAVTTDDDTLNTTGPRNMPYSDLFLQVSALPRPMPLRIEEYWTAADDRTDAPFLYTVSPDRWWRVYGDFPEGTRINAQVLLDGRTTQPSLTDPGLMADLPGRPFVEDSLVMLYRPDASYPWTPWTNVTVSYIGAHTDRLARFTINGLTHGDYTLGWRSSAMGITGTEALNAGWRYHPDPADDTVMIQAPAGAMLAGAHLRMQDVNGRTLLQRRLTGDRTPVDVSHLAPQTVLLSVVRADGNVLPLGRLVIAR
ncbi:MAG: M1 family metallopeptidase [Flavobacteriales bacterium]